MLVLENSEWRNGEQYGNCRCAGDFTNLGYGTWRQCYEKTERISRQEKEQRKAREDAAKVVEQPKVAVVEETWSKVQCASSGCIKRYAGGYVENTEAVECKKPDGGTEWLESCPTMNKLKRKR